jgi:hypothetical protein
MKRRALKEEWYDCPACAKHGLRSRVMLELPNPSFALCARNHVLKMVEGGASWVGFALGGRFVNVGAEKRFVTVFEKGKWQHYDLLALPLQFDSADVIRFLKLEKKQKPFLLKQLTDAKVAWMLCSARLGLCKDVSKIVASLIDTPYLPFREHVSVQKRCWQVIGYIPNAVNVLWVVLLSLVWWLYVWVKIVYDENVVSKFVGVLLGGLYIWLIRDTLMSVVAACRRFLKSVFDRR